MSWDDVDCEMWMKNKKTKPLVFTKQDMSVIMNKTGDDGVSTVSVQNKRLETTGSPQEQDDIMLACFLHNLLSG